MAIELAGYLALAIWVYLVAGRGGFWLERAAVPPALDASRKSPSVVAVVPARNEAAVVERTIASLAAQRYPGAFHIVLVDDGSGDGTAEAARAAAPSERLTVIRAETPAAGWTGKMWAVGQGVRYAARFDPDYLLLTDADIVYTPDALTSLVRRAEADGLVATSLMVRNASGDFVVRGVFAATGADASDAGRIWAGELIRRRSRGSALRR